MPFKVLFDLFNVITRLLFNSTTSAIASTPVVIYKAIVSGDGTGNIAIGTISGVNARLVGVQVIARDTTAATVTVKNGTSTSLATVTKSTTNNGVSQAATILTSPTIASGDTLYVSASSACGFEVWVTIAPTQIPA